jgi:HSP20 family molecular chaperone IbpA
MNTLPPWLAAPERLFAYLRERDMSIGTGEALRATALLDRLTQQGRAPQTSEEAARFLAPLLCTSFPEQVSLPPLLRDFAEAHGEKSEATRVPVMSVPETSPHFLPGLPARLSAQMVWIGLGIFASILMLLALLWLASRWSAPTPTVPNQEVQPTPIDLSYLTDAFTRLLVGLRYALLPWFAWLLFRRFRHKRAPALRRLQDTSTRLIALQPRSDRPLLFGDRSLRIWLQALRTHRQMPTDRLDVPRSLRATIAAGGRPVFLFGTAPRLPDYPILIEQLTGKDHLTALGRAITARLENERVAFAAYHYSTDPRQVWDAVRHPLTLRDVAAHHGEDMVVLVSDGDVLIDPLLGEVRAWVAEFAVWRNPVLLTPVPLQQWSAREQALTAAGFIVLPATPAGLQSLGEFLRRGEAGRPRVAASRGTPSLLARAGRRTLAWHHDFPPDPQEREALLNALAMSLPKAAFDLLCVLALFGEVRLDLTLAAGQALRARDEKPLLNEASFAALAWLPWFRLGRLPEWLRVDLAQCLDAKRMEEAHEFYKRWLTDLDAGNGSGEKLLLLPDRTIYRWLARFAGTVPGRAVRDVLFLSFMRKERLDTLDLEAPATLARLLRTDWADPLCITGGFCVLLTACLVVFARSLDRLSPAPWDVPALWDFFFMMFITYSALVILWHLRALGVVPLRTIAWQLSDPIIPAILIITSANFVGVNWGVDSFDERALVLLLLPGSAMALTLVASAPRAVPVLQWTGGIRPRLGEVLVFAAMVIGLQAAYFTSSIWSCVVVTVGTIGLAKLTARETGESLGRLFLFACLGAASGFAAWVISTVLIYEPDATAADQTLATVVPVAGIYGLAITLWEHGRVRLGPICGLTLALACAALTAPWFTVSVGWPNGVLPLLPLYLLVAYFALTKPQALWTRTTGITCCSFVAVAIGIGFAVHAIRLDMLTRVPSLSNDIQLRWTSAGVGVIALSQMAAIPLAIMMHGALLSPSAPLALRSATFAFVRRVSGTVAAVVLLPIVLVSTLFAEGTDLQERAEAISRRLFGASPLPIWRITAPLFWLLAIIPSPASGLVPSVALCLAAWIGAQFGAQARSAVSWGVLPFFATLPLGPISTHAEPGFAIATLLIFRLYAEPEFRLAALGARHIPLWHAAAAFLVLGTDIRLRLGAATLGGSALPSLDLLLFVFATSRAPTWPLISGVVGGGVVGFVVGVLPSVEVAGLTARYALSDFREIVTALVFIAAGAASHKVPILGANRLLGRAVIVGLVAIALLSHTQFNYDVSGERVTDGIVRPLALVPLCFVLGMGGVTGFTALTDGVEGVGARLKFAIGAPQGLMGIVIGIVAVVTIVNWFFDVLTLDATAFLFDGLGASLVVLLGWRTAKWCTAIALSREPPCNIFESDEALTILVALPGVELDQIKVTLGAGVLIVSGERPMPSEVRDAKIHRLEIPHGHFQRRIELPPARFELSGRHLANGCLKLQLHKV